MRDTLPILMGGAFAVAACEASRPIPVIPELASWKDRSMTICCNRTSNEAECSRDHWTQVIQQYCKGKATTTPNPSPSSCVTYACDGAVQPHVQGQCTPTTDRTVKVQFIVDPTYERYSTWQKRIEESVAYASQMYQSVGLRFSLAGIARDSLRRKGDSTEAYFGELRRYKSVGDADLYIGLLGTEIEGATPSTLRLGEAVFFGDETVIMAKDSRGLPFTLAHEVGHIFGAVHTDDYGSVMYFREQGIPSMTKVDRLTEQILKLTKCMNFRKGVESLTPQQAKLIGDLHEIFVPKSDVYPLAAAYRDLGQRALGNEKYSEAVKHLARATKVQPWHPHLRYVLGLAYSYSGKFDRAAAEYVEALQAARELPFRIEYEDFGVHVHPIEIPIQARLGAAYRELGQLASARQILLKVMAEAPAYPRPYLEMGKAATAEKLHAEAVQYLTRFLDLVPDNKEAKELLEREAPRT